VPPPASIVDEATLSPPMTFVPPPSAELVSGGHGGKKARLTSLLQLAEHALDVREPELRLHKAGVGLHGLVE
jgi:hypothetical protein